MTRGTGTDIAETVVKNCAAINSIKYTIAGIFTFIAILVVVAGLGWTAGAKAQERCNKYERTAAVEQEKRSTISRDMGELKSEFKTFAREMREQLEEIKQEVKRRP